MSPHLPLHNRIQNWRDALLATDDSICYERLQWITESYRQNETSPTPLQRARAFAHYLKNMSLDLESNPVFAGNTSSAPRAWMLLPEYNIHMDTQVAIENPEVAHILDGAIPPEYEEYWADKRYPHAPCSFGHLAVDLEAVIEHGLLALSEDARTLNDLAPDPGPEAIYRQAMIESMQAVIAWAERYAEAAAQQAARCEDPVLKYCHERVVAACRQVPARPAQNLFEGLQAILLTHLAIAIEGHGMSISIGSPDRLLAKFIGPNFDPEEARDLVAAFMLKITANSFLGRGYLSQAITVGGCDTAGKDQCNALTLAFLHACDFLRVGDPPLFVRWHEGLDSQVREKSLEMLARGVSMPLLVNDPPTAQGFIQAGLSPEDAYNYCVIGCNELAVPGVIAESAWCTSGTLLYVDLLNETLRIDHPTDMGTLMASLEARLYDFGRRNRIQRRNTHAEMNERIPTPFTSALMRGCIARGQDLLMGMEHHNPGIFERGLTNAANALAALEALYADGPADGGAKAIEPLIAALDADFDVDFGYDALRQRIRTLPKWGNDDERVDRWAGKLLACRERALSKVDAEFGDPPHMVCHVVRSLHHVNGRQMPATPDGRRAGQPLADSIGAELGTAKAGPTAILNSVLKIDASACYKGGYNLNLTLPPTHPAQIEALVTGFFEQGGQELQINSFDATTLRDAQRKPENYGDLLVRIAGLSARFVDLSVLEQEELIHRAEAAG